MPFIKGFREMVQKPSFLWVSFCKTAAFSPRGKDTFSIYILADPSAAWYNWKESHSEQFQFTQICSFCNCSESDTFLMNYTRFR